MYFPLSFSRILLHFRNHACETETHDRSSKKKTKDICSKSRWLSPPTNLQFLSLGNKSHLMNYCFSNNNLSGKILSLLNKDKCITNLPKLRTLNNRTVYTMTKKPFYKPNSFDLPGHSVSTMFVLDIPLHQSNTSKSFNSLPCPPMVLFHFMHHHSISLNHWRYAFLLLWFVPPSA